MVAQAAFFSKDVGMNYERTNTFKCPIKRNAFWNLWQSYLHYQEFSNEFEHCATVLKEYDEKVFSDEQEADFVLIIGESFNRHMSNLYDGSWETNPLLAKRCKGGRLFVFRDVIATDNGTTQNFKSFMSMASVGDSSRWCDEPLFPILLRRSGYRVIYYSNQFVSNDILGQWNASMGFINHPSIEPYIFDRRNTQTFPFDMQLVEDYASKRNSLEAPLKNFCIFHLYGQHMPASHRIPKGYAPFTTVNIKNPRLDQKEKQEVADYLNATHYNDQVVDSIISLFDKRNAVILYFSDHGEEIHNTRHQYGRTDLKFAKTNEMHQQVDVPFMIYLTPIYVQKHPYMVARMQASLGHRFTTDDVPQTICDILGVHSHYVRPERSVVNPNFKPKAHRVLQIGRRYD